MVVKVTLLSWLSLHSVAHRCGTSTTRVLQETRCHSAPHHLDHLVVFKGLLLCRLLGPYPGGQSQRVGNLHFKKQKAIVIQISGAKIGDSNAELDAVTTVFAIAAQILMILRYQESWRLWFWVDVLCVILWAQTGNWCMVAQYIFWTANCIYGLLKWKEETK